MRNLRSYEIARGIGCGSDWWISALVLLCASVSFLAGGCGPAQSAESEDAASDRLNVLTKQYVGYLNSHQNRAPASEADFKKVLADAGNGILKKGGASTVDELFVSPRDGQPFVIAYGAAAARLIDRGIIAYERNGKDGKHLVGYRLGFVEPVDSEKLRATVPKP